MPHLSQSLKNSRHTRNAMLGILTLASATLLGGCSIWPKAATTEPTPVVVAPAEPVQAVSPSPCTDCASSNNPSATAIPQGAAASQPLQPKPEVTSTAMAEPAKAEAPSPGKVQPAVLAPSPKTAAPPQTQTTSDLAHGYYLNVGLFAVPENGSNAYQKLESAGLPVFSDSLETKKGKLTRVRVGPFATRAKAVVAAKKIHALKLEAVVFRH